MTGRRILVVDDDATIADSVTARLRTEGFEVEQAADGPGAIEAIRVFDPELVVLDVMLPGFDGLEVCRRAQAIKPVLVLMLTARSEETDLLVGLATGADDYLSKPFSMRELVARTHAILRRQERVADARQLRPLQLGDITLDLEERRVHRGGAEVHLTRTEFDLLAVLASRPRAAFSRDTLLAELWGWGDEAESRTVDSHVKALRRKLGADCVRTVRGVGYALNVPR